MNRTIGIDRKRAHMVTAKAIPSVCSIALSRKLTILVDGVDELVQSILPIRDRLSHTVFD
jgi:hypothetical protein